MDFIVVRRVHTLDSRSNLYALIGRGHEINASGGHRIPWFSQGPAFDLWFDPEDLLVFAATAGQLSNGATVDTAVCSAAFYSFAECDNEIGGPLVAGGP